MHSEDVPQNIRWLLRDKYHWSGEKISAFFQDGGEGKQRKEIESDLKRLRLGEPLAYIVSWVSFLDCQIDLSLRPLIPRPETEYWVGETIKKISIDRASQSKKLKILDLCCGSGCIGIACLKHLPAVSVDFVDISEKALQQTKINVQMNHISSERYALLQSNLFQKMTGVYNFILCNPPYIDDQSVKPAELAFEPNEALYAKDNGLYIINKILTEVSDHLLPQGQLIMEFGQGQEKSIAELAAKNHLTCAFYPDQYGTTRYVINMASPKL